MMIPQAWVTRWLIEAALILFAIFGAGTGLGWLLRSYRDHMKGWFQ